MNQHLKSFLVFLIFLKIVNSNLISVCNDGVSFRDSKSCSKYYTCVKNSEKYFSLEERHCPDFLFFEPSLNECKPAHLLTTECLNSTNSVDEKSNLGTINNGLINKEEPNVEKSTNSNSFSIDDSLQPTTFKHRKPNSRMRTNTKSGGKIKKNKKKLKKKKNNKNWVAIYIRGCSGSNSGGPNEDYDESGETDEQEEEQKNHDYDNQDKPKNRDGVEDSDLENDPNYLNNSENNLIGKKNKGLTGGKNNNSNDENRQKDSPSKNCTCEENNNRLTTGNPDLNHEKDNLNQIPDMQKSRKGPAANTYKSAILTPINASSSTEHPTTSTTTMRPTSTTTIKPTTSTKTTSTTTLKPATITKQPSTRLIVIPRVMPNPYNNKNGTMLSQKEALEKFLYELRKRKPSLSEGKTIELADLFQEKLKKDLQSKPLALSDQSTKNIKEPESMNFKVSVNTPETLNFKANEDEFAINLEDLEKLLPNYFANTTGNNSANTTRRDKKSISFIQKIKH